MVEAMAEPVATTGARTSSPGKGPAEMKSRPSSKHMSRPSSNGSVKRASGLRESVNGTPSRRPSTLGKGRPSSREKGSKGATRASQENGVSLDSLVEKPKPVAGLESLFLTGTTLKIIGLEEELGTDALKELPLKVLLDDIQFRGAISDFHPIREKLKVGQCCPLVYLSFG